MGSYTAANEIRNAAAISKQGDREIRIERTFNAPRSKVWRAYTEDRDGMMQSGMEQGLNQSYAALDALLARID